MLIFLHFDPMELPLFQFPGRFYLLLIHVFAPLCILKDLQANRNWSLYFGLFLINLESTFLLIPPELNVQWIQVDTAIYITQNWNTLVEIVTRRVSVSLKDYINSPLRQRVNQLKYLIVLFTVLNLTHVLHSPVTVLCVVAALVAYVSNDNNRMCPILP